MNKMLTIGLAAATLAGGMAASAGAAQAADWNHGGRYESDHHRGGDRHHRGWERGDRGYGYGYGYRGCREYRTWNSYRGRYTTVTRCF